VAGFIGSPPMNLLTGRAEGGEFVCGDLRLPLPGPAPRECELLLGLRPEHAGHPDGAASGTGWPLRVELVEMLGAERLVHGRLGGQDFTWRLDATLPAPRHGSTQWLQPPAGHLHWFDPTTSRRIV
jgi:sn-glycerol 3-phosphate transport system ATP-binding protein